MSGVSDPFLGLVADRLAEQDRDDRLSCHDDPVAFANEFVVWPEGKSLTPYQSEIMGRLVRERRVSARGPHGLGKSALSAITVLWFAVTRERARVNWKVLTTASSWRQLEKYLWPEVHLWARRLRWDALGRAPFVSGTELMNTMLKLRFGQAFAGASDDPALLEGAHADSILVVFDESKTIPAGTWESLEGALSGTGEAFALAVSTPGAPSGVFYDIHSRKPGYEDWWVRHVTLDEACRAGQISDQWADARRRQWGAGSAVFKNRVLGEFASTDDDAVIPLEWVEQANERWRAAEGDDHGPLTVLGVDVAREGADKTVFARRYTDWVGELEYFAYADTTETAGRVLGVMQANPGCRAVVDVIGVGGGVVDQLRKHMVSDGSTPFRRRTVAFQARQATQRKDRSGELGFVDTRSAAWWWLREQLDPAFDPLLALPPDDLLIGDLTAPHWEVMGGGRIKVESKADIKKRIGRSTDAGDAVVQGCFDARLSSGGAFVEMMKTKIAERHDDPQAATRRQLSRFEKQLGARRAGPQRAQERQQRVCQHRWRVTSNGVECAHGCGALKEPS